MQNTLHQIFKNASDSYQRPQRLQNPNNMIRGRDKQVESQHPNNRMNEIVISSDEDDKQMLQKCLQNLHFKYQVTKAQLTRSRFNILMAITREFMHGSAQNKSQMLQQFIIQFVAQRIKINPALGYFYQRMDIGLAPNAGHIYETKYLLYGTDLLQIGKISKRFAPHAPRVTRINGSHCLLQFKSPQISQDFLMSNVSNFKHQLLIPLESNSKILARNWVELNTYFQIIFVRQLFIRNLTYLDQQQVLKNKQLKSNSVNIQQIKEELQTYFLSNDKVKMVMKSLEQEELVSQAKSKKYFYKKKPFEFKQDERRHRSRSRTRQKEKYRFDNKVDQERHKDAKPKSLYNMKNAFAARQPINNQHTHKLVSQVNKNNAVFPIAQQAQQKSFIVNNLVSNPKRIFQVRPKIQQPEVSSDFLNVQNQLQRFHLNSSQFSSIFQKSRHQMSGVQISDENNSSSIINSNQVSSNVLNSNPAAVYPHQNLSNSLFSLQAEQISKQSGHRNIREQQIEDEQICEMFQINTNKQAYSNISEVNLRVSAKPIDRSDILIGEQQAPEKTPKKPKKKQISKPTEPLFIDID